MMDVAADAQADVGQDAALDGTADTAADVASDVELDAAADISSDGESDAAPDVGGDAARDTSFDAALDTGADTAQDVASDAGSDASLDVASDASLDTPPDAVPDAAADSGMVDSDGDGVADTVDCAPLDPLIHQGAADLCDGVDNDCDGMESGAGFLPASGGPIEDVTSSLLPAPGETHQRLDWERSGTLHLCGGTWPTAFASTEATLTILGHPGADGPPHLDTWDAEPVGFDVSGTAVVVVERVDVSSGLSTGGAPDNRGAVATLSGTGSLTLRHVRALRVGIAPNQVFGVDACVLRLEDVDVSDFAGSLLRSETGAVVVWVEGSVARGLELGRLSGTVTLGSLEIEDVSYGWAVESPDASIVAEGLSVRDFGRLPEVANALFTVTDGSVSLSSSEVIGSSLSMVVATGGSTTLQDVYFESVTLAEGVEHVVSIGGGDHVWERTSLTGASVGDAPALALNRGTFSCTDCALRFVQAGNTDGAAIRVDPDMGATTLNGLVVENSQGDAGNGIVWLGRPASLDHSEFRRNRNGDFSAGVFVDHTEAQEFNDAWFEDNDGGDLSGAGIYVANGATLTLRDCTFRGNVTGGAGSAVYVFDGVLNDVGGLYEDNYAIVESAYSAAIGIGRGASFTLNGSILRRNVRYGVSALGTGTFIDVGFGAGDESNRDRDVKDATFSTFAFGGVANGSCVEGDCRFEP